MDSLAGFRTEKTEPTVPAGLLKAARKSGQLNLSGRGLTQGNAASIRKHFLTETLHYAAASVKLYLKSSGEHGTLI